MALKPLDKKKKVSISTIVFLLLISSVIYAFFGIRYELSEFSKIFLSLISFVFFFLCYKKSASHLSLALLTSVSIFICLVVSFGSLNETDSPFALPIVLNAWWIFSISFLFTLAVLFLYSKLKIKDKYPVLLFGVFVVCWIILAFNVKYFGDWKMENWLNVPFIILLAIFYRWFKFSNISYSCIFVFMVLNVVGSHYTYAEVPFGFWLQEVLNTTRNHYDRIVHFCFGLLFAYPMREIFKRIGNAKGFWALWIPIELVLALSCIYELMEWGIVIFFGGDLGVAYLGSQGDVWDAQKDMALAGLGSVVAMLITCFYLVKYNAKSFWKEFVDSLKVKDEKILGERALEKLEKKN